jgi:hypothetical protein
MVVPLSVAILVGIAVLAWAVAIAVTVVVFVAPAVLFALWFLRILALAVGVLRVRRDVPRESRVSSNVSVASLETVVTSTSAIAVCAVSPYSEASPRYTAVLGMSSCAQSTLVVSRLTAVFVLRVVSFSRAILVDSLSPAAVC